jgi:hypothetical protein
MMPAAGQQAIAEVLTQAANDSGKKTVKSVQGLPQPLEARTQSTRSHSVQWWSVVLNCCQLYNHWRHDASIAVCAEHA